MAKLYLDSNIVIRVVEGDKPAREALSAYLATLGGRDGLFVVSDLVYMECLVKPLAVSNAGLRAAYEAYLEALDVVALTRPVCLLAAAIRAKHRFASPDALHLAAAIEADCDAFVTGDQHLSSFPGIEIAVIAPDLEQAEHG